MFLTHWTSEARTPAARTGNDDSLTHSGQWRRKHWQNLRVLADARVSGACPQLARSSSGRLVRRG
eukprot:4431438-Pleurochrysis_carterae.AAC.2